jgi:hypothetical protein
MDVCYSPGDSTYKYTENHNGNLTIQYGTKAVVSFPNGSTTSPMYIDIGNSGTLSVYCGGEPITSSMIPPGWIAEFIYDDSFWNLLNPYVASTGGGTLVNVTLSPEDWVIDAVGSGGDPGHYIILSVPQSTPDNRKEIIVPDGKLLVYFKMMYEHYWDETVPGELMLWGYGEDNFIPDIGTGIPLSIWVSN